MSKHLFSRRGFLGAAAVGLGGLRSHGQTAQVVPAFRNPTVYRFAIGDIEAFSISDGRMLFRNAVGLMHPESERPAMAAALERESEIADPLTLYINILALRVGREVALFDAGFGRVKNPDYGWLREGLAQAGIANDQVTATYLSHAHVDHIGGFVTDNRPTFPNAALYLLKDELDFWHREQPDFSRSRRNKTDIPGMIKSNREKFEVLKPHLQPVADGTKTFGDAVAIEAAPGHTAGHAVFRIASKGESLLHLMDAVHHHVLMFADPGWTIAFDHDPDQAVATRRKLFAKETAQRTRLYGFHLPWPGLGHLAAAGSGYRWVPERMEWTPRSG